MSGFPVPAKAKEAAHKAIVDEVEDHLRWNVMAYGKAWTEEGEDTVFIVAKSAEKALAAALPAMAADPDLIERLAEALFDYDETREKLVMCGMFPAREWPPGTPQPSPVALRYREQATEALAALFGVASPSTKETE